MGVVVEREVMPKLELEVLLEVHSEVEAMVEVVVKSC